MRGEDIDKIITTYQQRKSEDKYSHVAKLEEIVENDYNLNIPRYVDTFEEEAPIDLGAVTKELKELESEMGGIDEIIRGFCDELGVEAPC